MQFLQAPFGFGSLKGMDASYLRERNCSVPSQLRGWSGCV